MAPKEVRDLVKEAERQGWRVEFSRGHYKLYAPNGDPRPITVASTPSDHRWLVNTVSKMRRHGFVWKGR